MRNLRMKNLLAAFAASATLAACSHGIKKADIANTASPTDEVAKLENGMNEGYAAQYDVLAPKEFAKAQDYLTESKEDLRKGKKQQTVLDDVGYGEAFLQRTKELAEGRQARLQGVLDARKTAIDAGARNYPNLRDTIKDIDDETRSVSDDRSLATEKFNDLQQRYQKLELQSIQATKLGQVNAKIDGARRDGAARNTPNALKVAELDATNAKNVIAANRHDPESYKTAVDKSEKSAQLLTEVLAATKRGSETVSESVAMDLVRQQRQMASLKGELGQSEEQTAVLAGQVSAANRQLTEAQKSQNLETALADAQKEFSKDEAEVYRQGDKLLIRLKSMNFPSGKSDLPTAALPLLAKVKGVASTLNPQQVVVEGHTDSLGLAATNMELSQNRAQAVADYFSTNGMESGKIQAVGEGYKAPIASNKTKAGRAQNRRVDVIITPGSTVTQ